MEPPPKHTFGKKEHLKSEALISRLFTGGLSLKCYPLKAFYDFVPAGKYDCAIQVGFSVPAKNFRKAVERNLIKRRMREAYRINKGILARPLSEKNKKLVMMILYLPKKTASFDEIQGACVHLLNELSDAITVNNE